MAAQECFLDPEEVPDQVREAWWVMVRAVGRGGGVRRYKHFELHRLHEVEKQ